MTEEPLEQQQEQQQEEDSRRMDPDVLCLSRIIRMLDRMPESSRRATMLYLSARYNPE